MISRMFKVAAHQRYDYKPRYYDPEKEEREERLRLLAAAKDGDKEAIKARISAGMRRQKDRRVANVQTYRSNRLLLLIVIVLIALVYIGLVIFLPRLDEYLN